MKRHRVSRYSRQAIGYAGQLLGVNLRVANCVAFYARPGSGLDFSSWYRWALSNFSERDLVPDLLGAQAPGFTGGKLLKFQRNRGRLERALKNGGASDFQSITLGSTVPVLGGADTGFYAYATCVRSERWQESVLCLDNALGTFDFVETVDAAKLHIEFMPFDYGIAYQRSYRYGPVVYAMGMTMGLGTSRKAREEARRISNWANACAESNRKWPTIWGYLRDVYPINFLTAEHLSKKVSGELLSDWIARSSDHGGLTSVAPSRWIWKVPANSIAVVREALRKEALLVAYWEQ